MTSQLDLWPTIRAALAETTRSHFAALRKIAATPDPRLVAAEAVAAAAVAFVQEPATWLAAETVLGAAMRDSIEAGLIAESAGIRPDDLTTAHRRLEALDTAARSWAELAYDRSRGTRR